MTLAGNREENNGPTYSSAWFIVYTGDVLIGKVKLSKKILFMLKPTKSSKASIAPSSTQDTLILKDMYLDRGGENFSFGNKLLTKDPFETHPSVVGGSWFQHGAVENIDETEKGEYHIACIMLKGWWIDDDKIMKVPKMMCDIEICLGEALEDCVYLKGTTRARFGKGGRLRQMESFHATVTGGLGAYEGSIGSAADLTFEEATCGSCAENPPTFATLTMIPYYRYY